MNLDKLLQLHPRVHLGENGNLISWAIGEDVLRHIDSIISDDWYTAETGAGISTLMFVINGCRHISISPAEQEFDIIYDFCRQHDVDTVRLTTIGQRSELALPALDAGNLDLFLIDGRHAFPSPFIDWFYAAAMLKVGGLMVVDDTQLLTGKILKDFLAEDSHWRTADLFPNTAVFEKLDDQIHNGEWDTQAYIQNRM